MAGDLMGRSRPFVKYESIAVAVKSILTISPLIDSILKDSAPLNPLLKTPLKRFKAC